MLIGMKPDEAKAAFDRYEKAANKVRAANKVHLEAFEQHLKDKGLTKKTIDNHVSNVDFYINEYLVRYDIQDVTAGCSCANLSGFLGDWFIRKTSWASCSNIKGNSASFKKFYALMLEKGVIKQENYDMLCETIKEEMPEWLATMKTVEEEEFDW